MDSWNPQQYEKFRSERTQPFHDLLALVHPREEMRVVDLGCGTGELTVQLHKKLNARETIGIDSSANMLERSRGFQFADLHFKQSAIETFASDEPFDLIFSNAAIQWVDDHPRVLA